MNKDEIDSIINDLKTDKEDLNIVVDCLTKYIKRIKNMKFWERILFLITGKFNF
jgi:hypothetical protein